MFKSVQEALIDQEWAAIDIEVYFYWNEEKLDNSGQIHIKSKNKIGFFDGEIVEIKVDMKYETMLIISTNLMRIPGKKAKEIDSWRTLTQGTLKYEDFDFKHRPLFTLLNITETVKIKGKKIRLTDFVPGFEPDQFAIMVDLRQILK